MTAKLSMRKYKIKIHVFCIKSNNAKYNQFNHHKEIILNDSEYMHNVNNTSEQLVQANLMQCPISCSVADNDLLPASYFRHRLRSWSCRRTVVRRTRFAGGWPLLSRKMSDSALAQSRRRASIRVHTVGWAVGVADQGGESAVPCLAHVVGASPTAHRRIMDIPHVGCECRTRTTHAQCRD